ncbi:hypothetical protein, partial [uncultured Tenacibaculum sp.]|uniref:hypothetical protein n=1 Tax=uncultured Tenacibaculum sp. TaxID=174713 RepID=UPI00261078AC
TGLGAGTYDVRIEDSNGCGGFTGTVTINNLPTAPTLSESVAYNCDGTGNITITPTPAGTYTYELLDSTGGSVATNGTGVFNGQAVGSYTVEVNYGSGCTTDIGVVILDNQEFT